MTTTVDNSQLVPLESLKPFATLTLGYVGYIISSNEEMTQFAYSLDAAGERRPLKRTLKDGWTKIGSEIIQDTRDALREYVSMHMLKMKGEALADGPLFYNLFDRTWIVRMTMDADGVEIKFSKQDWTTVKLDIASYNGDDKAIVIDSLIKARPDIRNELAEEIDEWGQRLSAGASVAPIM